MTTKDFTAAPPRPLPVIILADVSGSMATDGKVESLNLALRDMIKELAAEEDGRGVIHVGVVTFGQGGARQHLVMQPAHEVTWTDIGAGGQTPLGAALELTRELLEDEAVYPTRAYRPTVVLVSDGIPTDSDGIPTDDWRGPLARLKGSERAGKAFRLAMGIGADADRAMLEEFIGTAGVPVFQGDEARQIRKFFRWVTATVTARSRSMNPNQLGEVPSTEDDDFDF